MRIIFLLSVCLISFSALAEDGYRLWLRYEPVQEAGLRADYQQFFKNIRIAANSPSLKAAKEELTMALPGLLGSQPVFTSSADASLIITSSADPLLKSQPGFAAAQLGTEGFQLLLIKKGPRSFYVLTGNTDKAILYAVFYLLRQMQMRKPVATWPTLQVPRMPLRMLNHWDNLDRTIERGYAGFSIWNWPTLPDYIDKRYIDYARANASIGINATVLTNVNANAIILTPDFLLKVKALADVFRPYGIKVFLTARFSAPMEIGGLTTADPLDPAVRNWWKQKVDSIYQLIPDFGGFLVKANSEGQPGPQDYHRNHADGANMLAAATVPHGGIIIWRSFVYSQLSDDRFKQAYEEFTPLDTQFSDSVFIQVKNGPIDFQPREPISPLFGAMPNTPLILELQLTQEYLGQSTHLVYEAPLMKECLETDTYQRGDGTTVASLLNGTKGKPATGMAAVSNIGNAINWTFHPFGQANWYAYGRLCWDDRLDAAEIAEEWIRQTFGNEEPILGIVKKIMMESREAMVNYMTPLGLHHIMNNGHHYGPAPWANSLPRADWNPVYYHRADSFGIGFDRTASGSGALLEYAKPLQERYADPSTCPDEFLLWFHHLSWNFQMKSGKTLWQELCLHYQAGVDSVRSMQKDWATLSGKIDDERFEKVQQLLAIQAKEAEWWRDACLTYFQTFSRQPLPAGVEPASKPLSWYQSLHFPYRPG